MEISINEFNEIANIVNDLKTKTIKKGMKINISNYEIRKISELLSKWNKDDIEKIKQSISFDSEFIIRCKVYSNNDNEVHHFECTFE